MQSPNPCTSIIFINFSSYLIAENFTKNTVNITSLLIAAYLPNSKDNQ